jgi:hypothetical protein
MAGHVITLDESPSSPTPEQSRQACESLERGGILLVPQTHLVLSADDRSFLGRVQHNVSLRPKGYPIGANLLLSSWREEMRGFGDDLNRARMRHILESYAAQATRLVERLLTPYTGHLHSGFTTFRAEEEQGRKNTAGKRSDLLHINAFPDLPTRGGRILRVFTNLNESSPRIWQVGERFDRLAAQYAHAAGLIRTAAQETLLGQLLKKLRRCFPTGQFRLAGSSLETCDAYDRFMLRLHDWMEANADFQRNANKERVEFPPGASWLVFTDGLPHAVVSGQFALDHTLLIEYSALVAPETAPVAILERLSGKKLT